MDCKIMIQKTISSIIYIACLILLFLSLTDIYAQYLNTIPPFFIAETTNIENKTIPAEKLGVKSYKKKPSSLYAKAYCVMDADTGRTLLAKNGNKKLPMASTTKIMTCLIALENGKSDEKVSVSSYAASMPDVQLNMQSGDEFYLGDLLYSLMLESHNDTAVAIAEHIGGTVEGFAKKMNAKAKEIGLKNTNFVTPNGLDDDKHYTTAKELCILATYAIKNKEFLDIIQTPSHSFSNVSGKRTYSVRNHDAFLTSYSGAIGIKTGFTGNAGYCFCGAAERNGKTLVSSVLACGWPPNKGYKWVDTKKLMDYGFSGFDNITLNTNSALPKIPVMGGKSSTISLARENVDSIELTMNKKEKIRIRYSLPETLSAPVQEGTIIGYEEYTLGKNTVKKIPLVAAGNVECVDWLHYLKTMISLLP